MPILNHAPDQQAHDNNSSTIMITSPDRNHQPECSLIIPAATSTPIPNDESSKTLMKKDEPMPITIEEISVAQPETTGPSTFI